MSSRATSHELTFEVCLKQKHIFCTLKEDCTVLGLKKHVSKILKIPIAEFILMSQSENNQWVHLEDKKKLYSCGFTPANAKVQYPATIGVGRVGDTVPDITPLSKPPPVPESMRHDHQQD
ncbi:unnamed protein product, partial [Mesorhabditis belari]|uniref:Uncharacterized protein n=1 Tax=Mesorhabditis belari TaxID=2138241 RepID=A0AAF3E806_9BILA